MVSYDLLRIISAFSVVILHYSAQFWYDLDVNSIQWKIANQCHRHSAVRFMLFCSVLCHNCSFAADSFCGALSLLTFCQLEVLEVEIPA